MKSISVTRCKKIHTALLPSAPSISFAILLFLVFFTMVLPARHAEATLPKVAVMPLDISEAGRLSYTGPAVQQMLISRLASENLDVISVESMRDTGADYKITGKVIAEPGNRVRVDIFLSSPESDEPVASWEIKPDSLGNLVTETGRYSIVIAQKIQDIENQKAILAGFNSTSSDIEDSDKPIIDDEQLRMARMHPDLVYREIPEGQKGTASPVDQIPETDNDREEPSEDTDTSAGHEDESASEKFLRKTLPPPETAESSDEEDDNWEPEYPPVYDDELARKMKEEARAQQKDHTRSSDEDDENIPDYPPDYESSSQTYSETGSKVAGHANAEPQQKEEGRSWWSYLWPFGGGEKKREMPKPVKPDRLPYPVPKAIEHPQRAEVQPAAVQDSFPMASIPPAGTLNGYGTQADVTTPETPEPKETETGMQAAEPEEPGGTDQDREITDMYNQLSDSIAGETADTESGDEEGAGEDQSNTENPPDQAVEDDISDVSSSFFNATEAAGAAAQDAEQAEPADMETAEIDTEDNASDSETMLSQPEEQPEGQEEAEQDTEQEEGAIQSDIAPHEEAELEPDQQPESLDYNNESAEDETATTPAAEQPPSPRANARNSKTGWFSWLWPDSWKGEDSEAASHTAPVKSAISQKEMQEEPPYHASSEPPPEKNNRKGPVWVWN